MIAGRRGLLLKLVLYVTATGLLTAFIGAQIARVDLSGGWTLSATFEDASGLAEGDQVKIAGAPVGRVDEIKVVNGRARVTMTVRDPVRIPADSQAAIRWRDAMGQRVVYLVPGTSRTMMRPGAHIARTRSVVDGGELINQLGPLTASLDGAQANELLASLAQAMDGNAADVDRLIGDIETLSATLAQRRRALRQMIADYATVSEIIARRDKQIAGTVDDMVTLSHAFTDNRRLIDRSLVELAKMARTSEAVLARNAGQLEEIVARLSVFTSGMRRNHDAVREVLEKARPKLEHIFAAVDNGEYMEVAAPCLTLAAPPCPYPTRLPADREGTGRVDTVPELQRLIVGGG
ncbi:MCE family protein [Thermomonospora cellulosilytica]|uniref:Phospholipid/cholesterol/gamma-HCH transport system substrate-binding protein n=1 Tax=Thermomonospora cellulosilytica TaxID=1411118 RepID=A0A7W3MW26_9ACTN|nr:MlaD family protein [Thermomonospora cellulosilytica]MBA9002946.1 phospholipid/cholesterol/gamma-HCH transport system substrate-binding protein [Thermomonospora cellulosilytica]